MQVTISYVSTTPQVTVMRGVEGGKININFDASWLVNCFVIAGGGRGVRGEVGMLHTRRVTKKVYTPPIRTCKVKGREGEGREGREGEGRKGYTPPIRACKVKGRGGEENRWVHTTSTYLQGAWLHRRTILE